MELYDSGCAAHAKEDHGKVLWWPGACHMKAELALRCSLVLTTV